MEIVFATSNQNKIREVQKMLPAELRILSLADIGCLVDIPETRPTIEGNALQKAEYVVDHFGKDCFSEDTGLEIKALEGRPGVYSARYAGPQRDPQQNIDKVLGELQNKTDRSARFKTVVALYLNGTMHTFEGIVEGTIRTSRSGTGGFGYDPIFQPNGYSITFAEMSDEEKNKISHRGIAIQKLLDFLRSISA
ncbi:MAG: non-canonical purine NTP diphosphatase [Bacteroidota bacterium]